MTVVITGSESSGLKPLFFPALLNFLENVIGEKITFSKS